MCAPLGNTTTPGWLGADDPPPRLELQAASESKAAAAIIGNRSLSKVISNSFHCPSNVPVSYVKRNNRLTWERPPSDAQRRFGTPVDRSWAGDRTKL